MVGPPLGSPLGTDCPRKPIFPESATGAIVFRMAADVSFPDLIAGLLTIEGETRTGLAEKVGVSRETLWRIETGEIRDPRWSTGNRIVRYHERISHAVTPLQRKRR